MDWKLILFLLFISIQATRQDDVSVESRIRANELLAGNELAEHINDLGLKILNELVQIDSVHNIVISPTTISVLLAMTLLGSVGVTFEEIVKVIGFSSELVSYRKHHVQFGHLTESLTLANSTKTLYANAIFVDENTRLRNIYKEFTEKVYKGIITNVDFTNASVTQDFINTWIKDHTNGKIVSFLTEPLPIDTRVVLLSVLHFSGEWEKPFALPFTRIMNFTKSDGTKVGAELMLNFGHFRHVYDEELDVEMLAIPYRGEETEMFVLKPRSRRQSLPDMLKRLTAAKIENAISKLTSKESIIRFPKMSLTYRADLRTPLKALGIKSMFDKSAHFGLMVDDSEARNDTEVKIILRVADDVDNSRLETLSELPNPGIHVDSVMHEVRMTINEYGTEASAVASAILKRSLQLFYADSPFYFFIRNEKTKLITFSAAIFDPTQQ